MPSAFIYNKTTEMKKKRITYGVYGMMEYQAIIKIGRATLKVLFTDGSMTSIGQNPAKYTTSDFLTQHAIENSSDFKRGRIQVVNTIELDEDVRIERNPAKPSTQTANVAAKAVIDNKPTEASSSHTTPVAEDVAEDVADETTEEADAGVVTPTDEADAETIEEEPETESETNVEEDTTSEETAAEDNTAEGKTEVEFTDNQEAKDYIFKNFGVKPGTMRNREDIKAVGATYGVKITFVNEK